MKEIDPVVGTWEFNPAKSKSINGPTPFTFKSATRTYTQGPEGIGFKMIAVKPDGSQFVEEVSCTELEFGKYYPVTGNPLMDSMAWERVDDNTLILTGKMGGVVMGSGTRSVSADGKVLTMTFIYLDADGILRGHVAAYDKQER